MRSVIDAVHKGNNFNTGNKHNCDALVCTESAANPKTVSKSAAYSTSNGSNQCNKQR